MVKKKKTYESPDITVTRVELESSICNGSVDFSKPDSTDYGKIEAQEINHDFKSTNDNGFFNTAWSNPDSSSSTE